MYLVKKNDQAKKKILIGLISCSTSPNIELNLFVKLFCLN